MASTPADFSLKKITLYDIEDAKLQEFIEAQEEFYCVLDKHMVKCWYMQDPRSCFMALDENQSIVGCIFGCNTFYAVPMVGGLIVKKCDQSKSLLDALIAKCINYGSNYGLNCPLTYMVLHNSSLGEFHNEFELTTYVGAIRRSVLWKDPDITCRLTTPESVNRVINYDAYVYGYLRKILLRNWFEREGTRVAFVQDNPREGILCYERTDTSSSEVDDAPIQGYGCLQKVGEVYYVGPMTCNSDKVAERVLYELITELPEDATVAFDTVDCCEFMKSYAEANAMEVRCRSMRLYSQKRVPINNLSNVYALAGMLTPSFI